MSVNLLHCTASSWRGAGDLCRWCNVGEAHDAWRFCSTECIKLYALNHQYPRAKLHVIASHRTCSCPQRAGWEPAPHVVCQGCGECEFKVLARDDKITVNHIVPRNGIALSAFDCIHHLDNLEPLCWKCHEQLNRIGNVRSDLTLWIDQYLPAAGWAAL